MIKSLAKQMLGSVGLSVSRLPQPAPAAPGENGRPRGVTPDMEDEFVALLERCRPFTMTSVQRLYALYNAVNYVVGQKVPGSFVECGVWKGGSSMMAALTLVQRGDTERALYLYDTFEGMSAPTEKDRKYVGMDADDVQKKWHASQSEAGSNEWSFSPIEEVRANMNATGYPSPKVHLVKGKVEETIPGTLPDEISVLRLDTDWFESTKHEMEWLFPRLSRFGVLILDDYGSWQGAREAVDDYFAQHNIAMLLHKADSARVGLKL